MWYYFGVANLPERSTGVPKRTQKLRKLIAKGWTVDEIVEALGRGDKRRERVIKQQLRRLASEDEWIQQYIGGAAKGALILGIEDITDAMVRRGSRGNVPAAKLAMEASGFHNPRMDHHHSGKIEISFTGVQRAPLIVDELASETIVDAEVVEE